MEQLQLSEKSHEDCPAAASRDVMDRGDFGKNKDPSGQDGVDNSTSDEMDAEKAHFVMQNRDQLIQNVNTVMAIIDSLGTMVHHEFRARIQAKETSMDQMRLLYTLMPVEGGINIKAAFYNALKQHEHHLLESMGSELTSEDSANIHAALPPADLQCQAKGPSVVPAVPPAQITAQSGGIVMSPTISGHIGGSVNINITVSSPDRGTERPSEDSTNKHAALPPADLKCQASETLAAVCQQRFKSNLREKFQVLLKKRGKKTLLNDIFTEIYITKGGSGEVNKEHEVRQIEPASMQPAIPENIISFEDMFKTLPGEDGPIRTVMTTGVAGIGKTVLTNKCALDWAEDKANQNILFMFPFTFRELNSKKDKVFSLMELLHNYFDETKEADICSSKGSGVVFIFDGLDECRLPLNFANNEKLTDVTKPASVDVLLTNLIKGDLLPSAHIWVTTRPAAADQIPTDYVDRNTEVRGFTDAQKEEYFMKRFSDKNVAKTIYSQIKKSRSLHILCHIPVFCSIIAAVLENVLINGEQDEKGTTPKTLTEMFLHFTVDLSKQNDRKYTDSTPQNSDVILSLGKLAFDQLENGNLIFSEEDLKKYGIDIRDAAVCSGVFTQILKEESGLYEDQVFCFVHLSVQEFLAALYAYVSFINNGDNVLSTSKLSKLFREKEDHLYQSAVDKALESPNGHLDLFLRFLLGLSLETNQTLLRRLLNVNTGNRSKANKKTIEYIKKKIRKNPSQERSINLFHCLNELNDHSLVEEIQQSMSSGSLSTDKLSPAQWSALVFILLSSEKELDVFDLRKYSASEQCLLRLLPVVKASNRAQLSSCNLSERCCKELASVLSSSFSLREIDLSNNDLQDRGVALLSAGLGSKHCRLEALRLSGCLVTEKGCSSLASALISNPSHLRELDLSQNHLGDSGVDLLLARQNDPHCSLEALSVVHGGVCWLKRGLRKCPPNVCELTLDPNTAHRELSLSENNREVARVWKDQKYPDHPDRFKDWPQVLCRESLIRSCYWEVEWSRCVEIAVTYRGINRQGENSRFGSNDKSWSLVCVGDNRYTVFHNKKKTVLPVRPSSTSGRVAVYVDWPAATVSFYTVSSDTLTHLHTFQSTFTKPLYAGFRVWSLDSSVRVCQREEVQ